MPGPRQTDPHRETSEPKGDLETTDEQKPPKLRTATPTNVPQTAGPASREETERAQDAGGG